MNRIIPSKNTFFRLAAGCFLSLWAATGMAQSVWDGGATDDFWSSDDNWEVGTAPVPGTNTDLQFAGTTRLTPNNDFEAASDFRHITFDATAGSFVLGGNAIDLFGAITNNSTNLQTIDLDLGMTSERTFDTASGDITLNGTVTRTGGGSEVIRKDGAGTLTLNGAVGGLNTGGEFVAGNGKLITVNAGTLAVNAAIGNLQVNGGTVRLDGADVLGGGSVIDMAGGTLDLNGTNDAFRALNGSSGLVTNNDALNTATLNISANAATNYGGTIEDGAGGVAVFLSQNTKTLTGNNTYSGGTTLAGALALGSDTAIGTGLLTANANATIRSDSDTARSLANNVSTAGTVTFGSTTEGQTGDLSFGTLTRANNNTNTVVHNVTSFTALHGGGQLQKTGDGTLVIGDGGASSFTGTFVVSAGALLIDGDLSTMDATSTVDDGTTIGGSGTLGGNWTVGGTLAPGNSPGTLTVENNLTLESTANSVFEINGLTLGTEYDHVIVGGALLYAGTLTIDFGFTPVVNDTFNLFDFDSQSGAFDAIAFVDAGLNGTFDNASGVLTVTAIPEPSALVLLAGGMMALLFRRRRAA